ncbi:MAG: DUF885 domain-containing protein [Gemmatimonadetes bacterium]|nr:DUF885 domain-containing protein [Gemmatimonadota bacterium]
MTVLDDFFEQYYRARPVTATFTGVHDFDDRLPDWSPGGLDALDAGMAALVPDLRVAAGARPTAERGTEPDWPSLDAALAADFLETQRAELASAHGVRGNPVYWTGEAIFGVISLMLRPSSSMRRRAAHVASRLQAVPQFLAAARATIGARAVPEPWAARALRECDGADTLLARGLGQWLEWLPRSSVEIGPAGKVAPDALARQVLDAAAAARAAFAEFANWLRTKPAAAPKAIVGGALFDTLLATGHACERSAASLLQQARDEFAAARAKLEADSRETAGSWEAADQRLSAAHPPTAEYLAAFERTWAQCRAKVERLDLVSWPKWPLRYVIQPEWAQESAPYLYFLPYRAPAPNDTVRAHDYLIPPIPAANADQHLSAWNHAVIKLNHVVHHGAIGHHVQNWFAYHRAESRVGRVAAVDGATRIGMFTGGTMAEGWACYATDLMDEIGFLTPLERLAQQHTRVRLLARAIVDIELHQGSMTFDEAVAFYVARVGMKPAAALSEATKNSLFPATAVMYWLGTSGIHALRAELSRRQGPAFALKAFHDALLSHGSIPVAAAARRMLGAA